MRAAESNAFVCKILPPYPLPVKADCLVITAPFELVPNGTAYKSIVSYSIQVASQDDRGSVSHGEPRSPPSPSTEWGVRRSDPRRASRCAAGANRHRSHAPPHRRASVHWPARAPYSGRGMPPSWNTVANCMLLERLAANDQPLTDTQQSGPSLRNPFNECVGDAASRTE
jgi:hypothetical protein